MNSVLPEPKRVLNTNSEESDTSFAPVQLSNIQGKPVLLDFEGGALSSDAGILLLREVEQQTGLINALAEVINDPRDPRYVKHTVADLLTQRIAQIASGYEDADDCDELRDDPIFKMFANRHPESGDPLSSQPTMSRFENSISRTGLYRLALVFADRFIASYEKEPEIIVLDADDTEDVVHGD
ncbi:MAG: transposase, partial [candidate division KSB1 bacterium]|nr:transposase [candidate division KSB1 bacterium]